MGGDGKCFGVRESKPPRNDALELSGIIRFDQGSTKSLPTRRRNQPITCADSGLSARQCTPASPPGSTVVELSNGFQEFALALALALDRNLLNPKIKSKITIKSKN